MKNRESLADDHWSQAASQIANQRHLVPPIDAVNTSSASTTPNDS